MRTHGRRDPEKERAGESRPESGALEGRENSGWDLHPQTVWWKKGSETVISVTLKKIHPHP